MHPTQGDAGPGDAVGGLCPPRIRTGRGALHPRLSVRVEERHWDSSKIWRGCVRGHPQTTATPSATRPAAAWREFWPPLVRSPTSSPECTRRWSRTATPCCSVGGGQIHRPLADGQGGHLVRDGEKSFGRVGIHLSKFAHHVRLRKETYTEEPTESRYRIVASR